MPKALPKNLTIKKSKIHGLGLFAKKRIPANTCLGISHIESDIFGMFHEDIIRTPIGAFINCDEKKYNCYKEKCASLDGKIFWRMYTNRKVKKGEELTLKYSLYKCGTGQCCPDK